MDIIGKWKVKQLIIPTLDGVIQCTPDNMPEGEIFKSLRRWRMRSSSSLRKEVWICS